MNTITNEIANALRAFGCKGKVKITRMDCGFFRVSLNGRQFGIYDICKHTFTA